MYKVGETYNLTGNEPDWHKPSETIADTFTRLTFPLRAECWSIDEVGDIFFRTSEGAQIVVHSSANSTYFWKWDGRFTKVQPTGGDFSLTNTHEIETTDVNFDPVQKPEHYNTNLPEGIEVLDIIAAQTESLSGLRAVCQGNLLKYALRWQKKNGVEDLKKAAFYLDRLIEEME